MADGDGRYLLNLVESLHEFGLPPDPVLGPDELAGHLARRPLNYDRAGDEHYNLISALHKSLRRLTVMLPYTGLRVWFWLVRTNAIFFGG